ncbi:hypothetical protein ACFIQG_15305 [Comamonas odontotermitis]|uniref:hypothetical protein n=1 Tax=Comamonas odontotermitis TaxID=379895 RepID=UPI003672B970
MNAPNHTAHEAVQAAALPAELQILTDRVCAAKAQTKEVDKAQTQSLTDIHIAQPRGGRSVASGRSDTKGSACVAMPLAKGVEVETMHGVSCLSASSLAALLGCAPHHVQYQLAKRMDFPRPLMDKNCRVRYWRADDVLHWLHRSGAARIMGLADLAAPRVDTVGLAQLLGCTRQHASDHIATRAGFPLPCVNVSRRMRYWLYHDVLQWLVDKDKNGDSSRCGTETAELLSTADIARLLGSTSPQLGKQLTRRAGFPAPVIEVSRRLRYWRASDVWTWWRARQHKGGAL